MAEPEKMKVAELRAALQERGLDTKGTKPILVSRLQEAIREEEEKEEPTPEPEPEKVEEEVEAPAETTEEASEMTEEVKVEEKMEVEETATAPAESEKVETAEEKKEEAKPPPATPQGVKRKMDDEPFEVKENEPEIADSLLCLDWHNSDLNLRILDTLSEGVPFTRDGWAYCYAAARATFGFTAGKIWYEVKYVDNMDVKIDKETTTYDLRVGWSTNNSSLMLGEDALSWCYSSCEGKMANNKKFEDYGEKFQKGDVIGAFLDFTQGEINVTFTKNGEDQGDAFQISKEDLGEAALFPHIMTRNVKFEVNFGIDKAAADKENWKDALATEYVKVGKVEEGERVRGNPRMTSRESCEMIMMIGLPGCGKTTWVDNYVAENPEKQYNVVSTTTMINKMTVNGEPRKSHHKGKWEQVVQKATRSLQEMIRAASQRRRNVIIDQTNVYPAAQKRKARPFEGFQRRAVVVLPTDEIYKERVAAQKAAKEMDIPDEAIMEMKANYGLPEDETDAVIPMFKEVTFTELDREEAVKVIELYNKVAKEKGYGKKHEDRKLKKFKAGNQRPGNFKGNQNNRGRNNNRPMRGMRGGPRGPPMRGGPWMRGRGGPMGPGPMPRGGMMNRGGPMGPSPWQGGNNMRNNMGGGPAPGNWGPWNQGGGGGGGGGGMGQMGNMNMGGPRPGMFPGNQGGNYGNNQQSSYGGNMGGMAAPMGQRPTNNFGGNQGGNFPNNFTNNFGGNPGGNFAANQGGNFGNNQGGNYGGNQGGSYGGNNPTGTWSNSSSMMRGQSPANNFGGQNFGNNHSNNYGGNKFSGNQAGGMRPNQGQNFGGMGGNFRGNMNRGAASRGMGMARGGGNRGNRGRRF